MKMQIRFILKKNSNPHLRKMQICFYFKKNSDLHLRKMQIVDAHFGKPSRRKKPSNIGRKELVIG